MNAPHDNCPKRFDPRQNKTLGLSLTTQGLSPTTQSLLLTTLGL